MKKLLYIVIISHLSIVYANDNTEKTILLHDEIKANVHTHLNKETCPVLYEMIEDIADKLKITMPRYITLFSAEYIMINEQHIAEKIPVALTAYKLFGDLHICKDALMTLSHQEIRGILSIALVDERAVLTFGTFLVSLATTMGFIYYLNTKYNLKLGKNFSKICKHNNKGSSEAVALIGVMLSLPSLVISDLLPQYLQKRTDLQVAKGIGAKNTIEGIKALKRMSEAYHKEGLIGRALNALKLKSLAKAIFYPIRPFTFEERIEYLQA